MILSVKDKYSPNPLKTPRTIWKEKMFHLLHSQKGFYLVCDLVSSSLPARKRKVASWKTGLKYAETNDFFIWCLEELEVWPRSLLGCSNVSFKQAESYLCDFSEMQIQTDVHL